MQISSRQLGDVSVLDVRGKITIGGGDVRVRDAVHQALEGGSRKILLNLKGVTGMDSSGLGEVVAAHASAVHRGGVLKLAGLSPKVASLLQLTQLVGVLPLHDSEKAALASFAK